MPKKDTDFSEADFKKEVNKILASMNVPLDPDGNYPEEVKELWPAIQSKLGKKLLAKNWRVWTTMWTNIIGPTYVSAAKEAAKYAGVKYTGEIGAFAKKYHRDHGLALCKTLTETDLQRVQDQVIDNWGIGEKAFEKKFQDDYIGSEARLKTIYRSEHARAISEGTLEVGQEVGHTYKQWWCSEDERSCEICMAHHEETVPMGEAFSGGFELPQDSHPSCRCVLITLEESDLSDDQKARMASRDPISLDDLDPTFQNSPWKSNEAFRQVLNYKCPENSHGPGFSCGGEETLEDEHVPEKQNSALTAIVQSAFEIALKTDTSKIKFNWNCKDSEKNGTGPGSCKDADNSNTKSEKSNKNPKSSSKPVKVGTYAKIYANKSPKAFPNQLYIVRMGEEDESQYNTKGNQFYGTDLDQLIQKALDSSKDSGRLIIGRVGKDKLDDNDLKDALNNNLEINPGYLSSMVAPVDTVIDTASGDTVYKRSQEELDEEHAKYIESEEFDKQLNQNTAISEYRNFGYQSINTVLRGNYVTDKSQKTNILDSRDVIPEDVVMKTKERIAHIHEAMAPLPKGTTLYRVDGAALTATLFESLGITKELNTRFSESGNNRPKTEDVQQNVAYWNKYLNDKLKDSEFQDLGFSSTSKGRAHISNDLLVPTTELSPYGMPSLLEISTPKGTRSIDVQERVGIGEGRYKEEKEVILDSGTKFKVKSVEFKFRGNEMYTHIKVDALQDPIEEKQNSIQKITQSVFETALKLGINKIKLNANCPESEKVGSGPGSCGGKQFKGSFELSKKSEQLLKKYKAKDKLKQAKVSIMASMVKSTSDEKSALENAKINASIFKGMTAEEADELTGDAAQEHTNWLMDKGPYYDIKQGISEPMLEDTEELWKRGWNVNGTYHPDIPRKEILDDAAAKIFTYHDEHGRFHKNAELIDAVEEYTGDLYDMYNKVSAGNLPQEFLKLTPEDQKELKDRIDNFAAALNTAELPEPVVTYRGIRETTLKRLEELGATEIGSEFQVNYFQSTTLNYETTKSFMGKDSKGRNLRIQIKLPKGSPAAYVDGFSANNGEDEVLVNRNLRYKCIDVKETDATKTLVWEAIL